MILARWMVMIFVQRPADAEVPVEGDERDEKRRVENMGGEEAVELLHKYSFRIPKREDRWIGVLTSFVLLNSSSSSSVERRDVLAADYCFSVGALSHLL